MGDTTESDYLKPQQVRVLRLRDMIFLQPGSLTRRLIHAIFSIALRLFFRRIEISRAELVPLNGPVIFVLNHPNGLIDPALVFSALPRRISFLAKSTLFRIPVISFLLRTVEALPLYRRIDPGEDVSQNEKTFIACHQLLRRGRCIALFPEGVSHSATQLKPIKTGAARIALGAISVPDERQPTGHTESAHAEEPIALKIVPAGLYYTSKTSFRSEALIHFGPAIEVAPVALDETGEPPRRAVKELSGEIERALREVTLNVEDDRALESVYRLGQLFSSIYESINIRLPLALEFNLHRRFAAQLGLLRPTASARPDELAERIKAYESEMQRLGIAPENLSLTTHSRWYVFRHFLVRSALLLLLAPLAILGALIHFPAYFASNAAGQLYSQHDADDIVSTVKILTAIVAMPLTWVAVSFIAFLQWGWRAALITFPVAVVCGYIAMRMIEELYDMRAWFKAVIALVRRRRLFLRLLLERRALHRDIERLGIKLEE